MFCGAGMTKNDQNVDVPMFDLLLPIDFSIKVAVQNLLLSQNIKQGYVYILYHIVNIVNVVMTAYVVHQNLEISAGQQFCV